MKKSRKLLAGLLSAAMMLSMVSPAFATANTDKVEGSSTGNGEVEGIVKMNKFEVALPTVLEGDTTFSFKVDPQGLVEKTFGARYGMAPFIGSDRMFFTNTEGKVDAPVYQYKKDIVHDAEYIEKHTALKDKGWMVDDSAAPTTPALLAESADSTIVDLSNALLGTAKLDDASHTDGHYVATTAADVTAVKAAVDAAVDKIITATAVNAQLGINTGDLSVYTNPAQTDTNEADYHVESWATDSTTAVVGTTTGIGWPQSATYKGEFTLHGEQTADWHNVATVAVTATADETTPVYKYTVSLAGDAGSFKDADGNDDATATTASKIIYTKVATEQTQIISALTSMLNSSVTDVDTTTTDRGTLLAYTNAVTAGWTEVSDVYTLTFNANKTDDTQVNHIVATVQRDQTKNYAATGFKVDVTVDPDAVRASCPVDDDVHEIEYLNQVEAMNKAMDLAVSDLVIAADTTYYEKDVTVAAPNFTVAVKGTDAAVTDEDAVAAAGTMTYTQVGQATNVGISATGATTLVATAPTTQPMYVGDDFTDDLEEFAAEYFLTYQPTPAAYDEDDLDVQTATAVAEANLDAGAEAQYTVLIKNTATPATELITLKFTIETGAKGAYTLPMDLDDDDTKAELQLRDDQGNKLYTATLSMSYPASSTKEVPAETPISELSLAGENVINLANLKQYALDYAKDADSDVAAVDADLMTVVEAPATPAAVTAGDLTTDIPLATEDKPVEYTIDAKDNAATPATVGTVTISIVPTRIYVYSNRSDKLVVQNVGTTPVDIALSAKPTLPQTADKKNSIALATGTTAAAAKTAAKDAADPTIYLGVVVDAGTPETTAVTSTTTDTKASGKVLGADESAFDVQWVPSANEYQYNMTQAAEKLKGKHTAEALSYFNEAEFWVEGACSKYSDNNAETWEKVKDLKPSMTLTWSITEHPVDKAPEVKANQTMAVSGRTLVLPLTAGSGDLAATKIVKVVLKNGTTTVATIENVDIPLTNFTIVRGDYDGSDLQTALKGLTNNTVLTVEVTYNAKYKKDANGNIVAAGATEALTIPSGTVKVSV